MSLAIVGTTSLFAGYAHHRRGHVKPKVALVFGGAGVVTALIGAQLTHLVRADVLMLCFAALMILVGVWMLKSARSTRVGEGPAEEEADPRRPRTTQAVLAGAAVGGVTGFLGVGGGFLVVPALIAFAGLGTRDAVGTSLLVIAINSAAGFIGHLGTGGLDVGLVAALAGAAVLGALLGERTGRAVPIARLRSGFAVFVVVVGVAVAVSSIRGGVGGPRGAAASDRSVSTKLGATSALLAVPVGYASLRAAPPRPRPRLRRDHTPAPPRRRRTAERRRRSAGHR
jgi:uncharacterized membrane protein YfcA